MTLIIRTEEEDIAITNLPEDGIPLKILDYRVLMMEVHGPSPEWDAIFAAGSYSGPAFTITVRGNLRMIATLVGSEHCKHALQGLRSIYGKQRLDRGVYKCRLDHVELDPETELAKFVYHTSEGTFYVINEYTVVGAEEDDDDNTAW